MPESDWANKRRKGGAGAGVLSKGMEAQAVWGGGEMDRPVLSHSVMSDSSRPHGPQPAKLLCTWNFPFPSPGDLPEPGIKPESLKYPALSGRFYTASANP